MPFLKLICLSALVFVRPAPAAAASQPNASTNPSTAFTKIIWKKAQHSIRKVEVSMPITAAMLPVCLTVAPKVVIWAEGPVYITVDRYKNYNTNTEEMHLTHGLCVLMQVVGSWSKFKNRHELSHNVWCFCPHFFFRSQESHEKHVRHEQHLTAKFNARKIPHQRAKTCSDSRIRSHNTRSLRAKKFIHYWHPQSAKKSTAQKPRTEYVFPPVLLLTRVWKESHVLWLHGNYH